MSRRRRLGQNFLVDEGVADAISDLLQPSPARIFEIGPGRGALTASLLGRFDQILALELDEALIPSLEQRFPGRPLEVRHGDGLTVDLEHLLGAGAPWQVGANLPYSVGTAILRRLLPEHRLFTRIVVMLQKEVAERVVARPGGKGHGLLALERAAHAKAEIALEVPPGAFRPRPKVSSAVVVVDLVASRIQPLELERALALASHALTRPRKKLSNALQPELAAALIGDAGLDPSARPGTVDLEGWLALARVSPLSP